MWKKGAIPMTTPWLKISSAASNVTWSISSITMPASRHRPMYLPTWRHSSTLCVPILFLAGCLPHALKLLSITPPLDFSISHLYDFISLFLCFYCPFLRDGLSFFFAKPYSTEKARHKKLSTSAAHRSPPWAIPDKISSRFDLPGIPSTEYSLSPSRCLSTGNFLSGGP